MFSKRNCTLGKEGTIVGAPTRPNIPSQRSFMQNGSKTLWYRGKKITHNTYTYKF
jgi:hypothetical protein